MLGVGWVLSDRLAVFFVVHLLFLLLRGGAPLGCMPGRHIVVVDGLSAGYFVE